jgi:ATP-binding protein involved in chromosome partitioning
VVENMAWLAGPDGARVELFGAGGGRRAADALSAELETPVPLLASVPISIPLREGADLGSPAVLTHPDDPAVVALRAVADRLDGPRGLAGRHLPLQIG